MVPNSAIPARRLKLSEQLVQSKRCLRRGSSGQLKNLGKPWPFFLQVLDFKGIFIHSLGPRWSSKVVKNVTVWLLGVVFGLGFLLNANVARAIDFYEIQIYYVETAPYHHFTLELHSNTVTTATGQFAREAIDPYQIHETLEGTYGVLPWLEVGQYLCTAKLSDGHYEYAGARTKVHFGVPQSKEWPIEVGANLELAYMRFQAEENPLTLEIRPILEKKLGRFTIVGNFVFEKPFSGPGTHKGVQFAPSGEFVYKLTDWVSPALEYYGDMGPISDLPGVQRQQHFVVPALNFDFLPQLELNLGVGVGVTRTSNGLFLKSIVGWTF